VSPGHKVARAWRVRGPDEKLAVGTNCLKAMMLDHNGPSGHEAYDERGERRASDVNDVGFSNEAAKLDEVRLPDRAEWKSMIVVMPCRSLSDEGDFELRCPS
jgi:hypothetical protein